MSVTFLLSALRRISVSDSCCLRNGWILPRCLLEIVHYEQLQFLNHFHCSVSGSLLQIAYTQSGLLQLQWCTSISWLEIVNLRCKSFVLLNSFSEISHFVF
ncbi:hypothetical protein O6H91_04G080900 [Diphasiastrum complanatum]|uniref:Uncharacterized protein n=1 Tax=Diphasiastrum complanatum TaxID=34168 RepID=A0ACC2DYN7_DIPCM|nr:hypothetical protein O6H91_04G080900 [Diphasiastrum complanatum]